ncbi:hypothetical protein [Streptomyces sp. NPDC060022]|uniref:hypothetical protein n=1 Tax=Streptomyces sp. NPDC060022 TaxID=3347039 RepID=UPI0036C5404E
MTTLAACGVLIVAQPAHASETVNWKPVKTNANWHCTDYLTHPTSGLKLKTCIVLNSSNDAQGVLVAQNPTSSAKTISGRVVFESQRGGDVWCATSNFAAGATAGCYAPTVSIPACRTTTDAEGTLNIAGSDLVYTVVRSGTPSLC